LGNPIYFALSAGSEHDCVCALDLLSKVNIEGSNILADKAYGSLKIRELHPKKLLIPFHQNQMQKNSGNTINGFI